MKFFNKLLLVTITAVVIVITAQFLLLFSSSKKNSSPKSENRHCIDQAQKTNSEQPTNGTTALPKATAHFRPHPNLNRSETPSPVVPYLRVSQDRRNVSVVIGIPSIKRPNANYLSATLQSLLYAMNEEEKRHVLIVVLLSDLDPDTVKSRYEELNELFSPEINSGLIDIISPSLSFYPDLDSIKSTLEDPPKRMKWRTKQVLDFAYIMMYAMNRGEYFLQVEDDIAAVAQFVTKVIDFTAQQEASNPDWVYLQFAELGYIGKLFRNRDLQSFVTFYVMFQSTKPVDWLLRHYITVKVCPYEDPWAATRQCFKYFQKAIVTHPTSLFQHVGEISSLDGKKQHLKETKFEQAVMPPAIALIPNPPADLSSSLKHHDKHTLHALYEGAGVFWAKTPVQGDYIQVVLNPPIVLTRFLVISGLSTAPSDILDAATFEVKPVTPPVSPKPNDTLAEFVILAKFDRRGRANGHVPSYLGKISTVRVSILKEYNNWVAISVFQLYS